jgi:hypothetical protein
MKNVSTMLFLGSSLARPAEDFGDNLLEKISNEINSGSRVYKMDSSANDSANEPLFLLDRPAFKKFLESHNPRERRYTDSSTSEFTSTTEQLTTTTSPKTSTVHDPDWTPGYTMYTTSTQFPTTQTIEGDPTTSTINDPTTTSTDSANDPDWEPSSTVDTTSTAVPTSTTTPTTSSPARTKRNWFLEWLDIFGFNW